MSLRMLVETVCSAQLEPGALIMVDAEGAASQWRSPRGRSTGAVGPLPPEARSAAT
jgi:hypothetical protein